MSPTLHGNPTHVLITYVMHCQCYQYTRNVGEDRSLQWFNKQQNPQTRCYKVSLNSLLKTDVAGATGQCRQCRVTGSLANVSQWYAIYFTHRHWVIFNDDFITNLLPSRQQKDSENQLEFGEDMGNSPVAPFFMARCSNVQTVWPNKASQISGAHIPIVFWTTRTEGYR